MNASTTNAGLLAKDVHVRFVRVTVFISGWLLVLLGAWMCGRRAFGGLQRPLPFVGFCILALLVVGLVSFIRIGWFCSIPQQVAYRKWKWFGIVVPAIGVGLLVASVSLPSSSALGLVACWTIVLGVEFSWAFLVFRRPNNLNISRVFQRLGQPRTSIPKTTHDNVEPVLDDDSAADEFEAGFSQSLTRKTLPAGTEEITGLLRGQFSPNQRSENLHVAFCPPLDTIPKIDCFQVSGAPARIKIGDVQTFGARFELKLKSSHNEDSEVVIHFVAQTTSDEQTAT